jgi:cytochrome c553
MTRILILLLAGSALALLPGDVAPAGCRHVAVRHVQVQPLVAFTPAYPQHYYAVGAPYQYEAIKQQIKAELRAEQQQLQAAPTPEALPLTTAPDKWALARASCVGCHMTNENAKAAIDMSDLSALTCEQKLACIAAVLDGKMPKGKKLDPQTLGNLLGEFSGAETAHTP